MYFPICSCNFKIWFNLNIAPLVWHFAHPYVLYSLTWATKELISKRIKYKICRSFHWCNQIFFSHVRSWILSKSREILWPQQKVKCNAQNKPHLNFRSLLHYNVFSINSYDTFLQISFCSVYSQNIFFTFFFWCTHLSLHFYFDIERHTEYTMQRLLLGRMNLDFPI